MKSRIALLAAVATTTWLALASPVLASDNGEGLVGETTDKVITFFSLGLVVFFALLVWGLSALQAHLDKRKEERKATDLRQQIGW